MRKSLLFMPCSPLVSLLYKNHTRYLKSVKPDNESNIILTSANLQLVLPLTSQCAFTLTQIRF